jgi:hypothetical protein
VHTGTGMVLPASTENASNYYVSPIVGPLQAGGVNAGDIIFMQQQPNGQATIRHLDSATRGTSSLSTDSPAFDSTTGLGDDTQPDISEDAAKSPL